MTLLNGAIQNLIRVQDLVNRLLHESLGGDLVDTSKPKWEKSQLTREKVEKQLESRRVAGTISQADFDAIAQALGIPNNAKGTETAQVYRNRLMHHIQPSVDYSMFFSSLESRERQKKSKTLRERPLDGYMCYALGRPLITSSTVVRVFCSNMSMWVL